MAPLSLNDTSVHATMAKRLPQFVRIQTNVNGKYLQIYKEDPEIEDGLWYSGDNSLGIETKFEVVQATTGTGLVHIRCLENNKYWAHVSFGTESNWVAATADTPQEITSDDNCTLFQPLFVDSGNNSVLKLRHVKTGNYPTYYLGDGQDDGLLCMENFDDGSNVCTFIDSESAGVLPEIFRMENDVNAMMAKTLPKFVMIQTNVNGKYLQLYKEDPDVANALRYAGDKSETRFEVEQATTGTGLVHIRCLENNKYWRNFGTGNNWITAMADKPLENPTDRNCTLFQPLFVDSNNNRVLKLRHVNTGNYATFFHGDGQDNGLLCLENFKDGTDVCTFIGSEPVGELPEIFRIENDVNAMMAKTLPKFVMIQTNVNGKYLRIYKENRRVANILRYGDKSLGIKTRFEVEPAIIGTGLVHIKCLENNKYWGNFGTGNNWIAAISDKPNENPADKNCTLFQPVFVDSNNNNRVLKLRHVNTGNYATFFQGSGEAYGLLCIENFDNGTDVCTFSDWKTVFPEHICSKGAVLIVTADKLPTFVIFQSGKNNRYLNLDQGNAEVPNALWYGGDYSFDLDTRFEVVPSTTDKGFIHIRSVRNNKYWVNTGTGSNWVAAVADKTEENQSDKHCTLFQAFTFSSDDKPVFGLRHVHTGNYISSSNDGLLYLSGDDTYDMCTLIDWKSVVMLPDRIRIKGDNGKYLKAYKDGVMDYVSKKADNSSLFDYQVFPSRDGGIRLKSVYYGTYWTDMNPISPIWLKKASTTVHETKTVFLPTMFKDKRIMLKCFESGRFCNRFTAAGGVPENRLCAREKYSSDTSYMVVTEPIISRTIENVRYHYSAAKRYNETNAILIEQDTSHRVDGPLTSTLHLKKTVKNTSNWSTSVADTKGHKLSFNAGDPKVLSVGFEQSREVSRSEKFGKTKTETLEVGSEKVLTIPKGTRVKATLKGTRLSYDIPFSYTQRDVLVDGTIRVTEKKDGVFTGENGYDYRYEIEKIPLE